MRQREKHASPPLFPILLALGAVIGVVWLSRSSKAAPGEGPFPVGPFPGQGQAPGVAVPPAPPTVATTSPPAALNPADVQARFRQFQSQAALDITAYKGLEGVLAQLADDLHVVGDVASETAVRNALLTV